MLKYFALIYYSERHNAMNPTKIFPFLCAQSILSPLPSSGALLEVSFVSVFSYASIAASVSRTDSQSSSFLVVLIWWKSQESQGARSGE